MKTKAGIFLLMILSCIASSYSQVTSTLSNEQKNWLLQATRHEKNGWIYIHIEGTPKERGFQYGYMLAPEIKESIEVISKVWHYQNALDWNWLIQKTINKVKPNIDSEYLTEMEGIAEGVKTAGFDTDLDEIIIYNNFMELLWSWWPVAKEKISINPSEPTLQSCSSFIAIGNMTSDGSIVLGHNTMFGFVIPQCNIILDIKPDKGFRILMQTLPGFIHSGTDFFITNAGLIGSETTIADFSKYSEEGIPEFIRMRQATQYASNIDEWCEIMKKGNNGGYANAWLLGDINKNEIARLELGLNYVGFEKKKDGYFVGSNLVEDLRILRFETKAKETDIKYSTVARNVRWEQLMQENKGKINLELAKKFEADHYDTFLNSFKPGGRSLCGHFYLDSDHPNYQAFHVKGTLDGKVIDTKMAKQMSFLAKWGSSCDIPFDSKIFLKEHPQFEWMNGLLKDRPNQPWTVFTTGETK